MIALFAFAIVFVLVGVVLSSRDDEAAPAEPSTTAPVAESAALEPEIDDGASGEDSGSSATAMVAGFGLFGLWVVGGAVALAKQRRRNKEPEQDTV